MRLKIIFGTVGSGRTSSKHQPYPKLWQMVETRKGK